MIKYRGTSLYPPAIFDLLNSLPQIETYVVELRQNDLGTDEIVIRAALNVLAEDFAKMLKDKFRAKLRVAPQIIFEDAQTINRIKWPEANRKPRLLLDFR
jgi:phenylacetate-CoA ligase